MKLTNYSKPILTAFSENTGYNEDINFKIFLKDKKFVNNNIYCTFRVELTSVLLTNLLTSKKAKIFVRVESHRFVFSKEISLNEDSWNVTIDHKNLSRTDKIYISLNICSASNFELSNYDEWIDIYKDSDVFAYHEGELLALSNEEKLDYKSTGEPFVTLVTNEERQGKGLLFDARKDNRIQIKVGPTYKEAYFKATHTGLKIASGPIIDSFLVFNAIVYSLIDIIQSKNIEDFLDKEWYKSLEHCFDSETYEDLAEFLNEMSFDNGFDINAIFEVAQQMLNNALEQKLIESVGGR